MTNPLRKSSKRQQREALRQLPTLTDQELAGRTAVFAPHPDDETLGCGGTILRKKGLGVEVDLVFLTDGQSSHAHLLPTAELAARRRLEALEAGRRLGVAADHIHFMECPDGRLTQNLAKILPKICAFLSTHRPAQLFVTHRADYPADHQAASALVRTGCREAGLTATLFEYPVWLWDQWPWVNPFAPPPRRSRLEILRSFFTGRLGRRLLSQLNCRVDIGGHLEVKKQALAAHETQTTRLGGRPDWMTLADVAHGEWLDCCLQPDEWFQRTRFEEGRELPASPIATDV